MPEDSIPVPDFYPRLNLVPGAELRMFTARLWDVVELRGVDWDEVWAALDQFYRRHDCEPNPENFAAAIAAEEIATRDSDQFDGQSDEQLPKIYTFSAFYGSGSEKDGLDYAAWSSQSRIKPLFHALLAECRRSGSVQVPAHWTPSTTVSVIHNGLWSVEVRDRWACYKGLVTDQLADMMDFASTLFADAASPWLLEGNGGGWNQQEAGEEISLYTWDSVMTYAAQGKYSAAIDSLRVLSIAGLHHRRFQRAACELVEHAEPSLRNAMLEEILRHARGSFPGPALPSELMTRLTELGLKESILSILGKIIYILRLQGGRDAFDSLAAIAQSAEASYARDAATRALAWLPRYSQRDQRVAEMLRSSNRRAAKAAQKISAEIKYHGLFSRDGEFASRLEHELFGALKHYLRSRGEDKQATQLLDDAFTTGFLQVEISGEIGSPACNVSVMTADHVPLHVENVYTREFCGLLDRLPSVDIPQGHLSDAELNRQSILRRTAGNPFEVKDNG